MGGKKGTPTLALSGDKQNSTALLSWLNTSICWFNTNSFAVDKSIVTERVLAFHIVGFLKSKRKFT